MIVTLTLKTELSALNVTFHALNALDQIQINVPDAHQTINSSLVSVSNATHSARTATVLVHSNAQLAEQTKSSRTPLKVKPVFALHTSSQEIPLFIWIASHTPATNHAELALVQMIPCVSHALMMLPNSSTANVSQETATRPALPALDQDSINA